MRLIRQCGLSAELFKKKTKLRQVRFIRRATYLPENTVIADTELSCRPDEKDTMSDRAQYERL